MPPTVKENNNPIMALIASCILFGMIGIFVREIKDMEAGSILFYRLFIGFAVILGYFVIFGGIKNIKLKQKKYYVLLLGILNTVTMFAYFSAIKNIGIPVAVLLMYTAPIYVTFLSPFLLKEHVTLRDMLALSLSISGILLAVNPSNLMEIVFSGGKVDHTTGILFGLLSGLAYGCSIMTVSYLKEVYSAVEQMFWSTSVSLFILLPFGVSVSGPVLLENLSILIPLGIIATAFASLLYLRGIARIKAQTAAVISLLEPVSSIFFCCMLLGEPIQPTTIGGCVFILAGAVMICCSTPRWPKISKEYFQDTWERFFQPYMSMRRGKL
ncbi:MAG: DMT family transporter [Methanosarcina sp.]